MSRSADGYALGHDDQELERLLSQSRFLGDLTDHLLGLAGLGPGMRVIDIGCGAGDVSFLAARLVGPSGAVVGVDRSAEAVELARARAADAGLRNVEFVAAELDEFTLEEPADALVGRLILLYLADAATTLRRLRRLLVPGGLVVCQEMDMPMIASRPTCPLYEATSARIREAFGRANADIRAGLRLHEIFLAAGLPAPAMIQGARVEAGQDSAIYEQVAGITRTLLPLMERTGVATAAEIDVATLADRLRAEAVTAQAVLVFPPLIGAWSRNPG